MSESILTSIKKLLGIDEDYKHFDADIMMHINTTLMILYQIGVGPSTPISISDASTVWSDFLEDAADLAGVKSYIYAKVRMVFDPPQSSAVAEALKSTISELEWRLNVACDPRTTFTATSEEEDKHE